jgi:hypothetical protein
MVRKLLLICGIVAPLLYVGSDILAAMRWEGYSYTAQSVSELRAIGAPTRPLLVPILTLYSALEIAFGVGVWRASDQKRSLRITGVLLMGLGVIDLVIAPFFQLNLGKAAGSLTNTMHVILTGVTVLTILLIIGFGANAGGSWFRFYSYATIIILIFTGTLAFLDLRQIAEQLPTPGLGVRERINIYGYMLWMMALALVFLRGETTAAKSHLPVWDRLDLHQVDRWQN